MEKQSTFQLSKRQKRSYALGAIPGGLLAYVFGLYYIDFFYQEVQMNFEYMVIGLIIYAVINAINDPLLGQLSDKTDRKKWGGRRIPYIKYGAPIWAITFVLLWFPWSVDNQIIMLLHYTITICAYDMMLTLVILCWMALLPEMTSNIDERNQVNFLVLLVGFFGLLPFLILVPIFYKAGLQAFQFITIIIAIISFVCYMILVKYSEEKPEFQKDEVFGIKTSIKEVLKYKSFRAYVGYNFCISFNGAIGLSFLFAYGYLLGGGLGATLTYLMIFLLVGYGSYVYCMKLRAKLPMRTIILRFGSIKAIGAIGFFFLLLIPGLESNTILVLIGMLWAFFFGGFGIFNTNLLYLMMDEDEVKHGTRREGMFLGMNALFIKPAGSFGPIIGLAFLELFDFVKNIGDDVIVQSDMAMLGIKLLYFIVPAIILLIGLMFLYFYPLHGEKLKELEEKLEIIHQQKKEKLKAT